MDWRQDSLSFSVNNIWEFLLQCQSEYFPDVWSQRIPPSRNMSLMTRGWPDVSRGLDFDTGSTQTPQWVSIFVLKCPVVECSWVEDGNVSEVIRKQKDTLPCDIISKVRISGQDQLDITVWSQGQNRWFKNQISRDCGQLPPEPVASCYIGRPFGRGVMNHECMLSKTASFFV